MTRTIKYLVGGAASVYSLYAGANTYRKKYMYQPKDKEMIPENLVTIKIWDRQEEKDVGHVALQFGEKEEDYLSFWPNEAVNPKEKEGMFKSAEPVLHTLREDVNAEGRVPDHELYLYLDKEQLLKEYEKIKEEVQKKEVGYCLAGRAIKGEQRCMNCTTAAYRVLVAGGLGKIPVLDDTITSPWHLHDILKQAENNQSKQPSPK